MSDVLFEVKKENLESGLRGYPVGYCTTSSVDPQKGLFYNGVPAEELAKSKEPEEVIYVILYGKNPTPQQLKDFKLDLQKRSKCSSEMIKHIRQLPRVGHPMKIYAASVLIAGMYEVTGDYKEDALNLIAKSPEIVANVIRHHAGWGNPKPSKPELGYVENFAYMLDVPNSNLKEITEILKIFIILHFDHGGGNLSTFVGKSVASSLEDIYGSIASAICALAGPRHGKANQDCLEFSQEALDKLGENATEQQVEEFIRKKLANNELIFGFGHAVLRVEDPRATMFYKIADEKYPNYPLTKIVRLLRKMGTKVLKENPKISDPYPNVDAVSGTILSAAGFAYPDYFPVLFGLARTVGISAQIVYERTEARDGKGTPIVRPKYLYKQRN
jgi:citrate synthase